MMLLALDVGNTSITVGLFRGSRLVATGRFPTHGSDYRRALSPWRKKIEAVVLSSVVPQATLSLKRALRAAGLPRPGVVGKDLQAPVMNRYRIPSQVGEDRLVNAAAACFLYGGPAIVVDFGTAITIDLVSKRREYLGGLIVPGIEIAWEALISKAALLPKVPLRKVRAKEFLGKDTLSSMASGILYGYSALCDGIVQRMKARYAPRAKVIATGGYSRQIAPYCRSIDRVSPDLTLRGLEITFRRAKKSA